MRARAIEERLWEKVDKSGECWLWTASVNRNGYGRISDRGRSFDTHRVAYELVRGPVPKGLELDHLCRVPACVNPDHLEPVTHLENVRRGRVGEHQRVKTACPQGHPYNARRRCLVCHRAAQRRYRERMRDA